MVLARRWRVYRCSARAPETGQSRLLDWRDAGRNGGRRRAAFQRRGADEHSAAERQTNGQGARRPSQEDATNGWDEGRRTVIALSGEPDTIETDPHTWKSSTASEADSVFWTHCQYPTTENRLGSNGLTSSSAGRQGNIHRWSKGARNATQRISTHGHQPAQSRRQRARKDCHPGFNVRRRGASGRYLGVNPHQRGNRGRAGYQTLVAFLVIRTA